MVDYSKKTIVELKEILRKKGLPVSGNKAELISRLTQHKANMPSVPNNVIDKDLYRRIRDKVKKRVKVWPSAYASGQLVSEYKKAGGRYKGERSASKEPLDRWYREEWVNVCEKRGDSYAPCGRKASNIKKYPYCRPLKRISKATPVTVGELKKKWGDKKLKELCIKKRSVGLPKSGKPQRIRPQETRGLSTK